MDTLNRYACVLSVIKSLQKTTEKVNETKIQKTMFFIEEIFPEIDVYEFIMYKYGPFSFDLRDDLGHMVAKKFLRTIDREPYGTQISEDDLSKQLEMQYSENYLKIKPYSDFIAEKIGGKGIHDLEAIGTALFIIQIKDKEIQNITLQNKIKLFDIFKPHIDEKIAIDAIEEVKTILEEAEKLKIVIEKNTEV